MRGNIVITGVSTGIGYAALEKFISEGYRVFGSVRKAKDAAHLQSKFGDPFVPLIFDVTKSQSIHKAAFEVSTLVADEGVKLLINNAGVAVTGPTTLLDVDDYRFQFEVNLFGLIEVTKAFLPLLGASKNSIYPPGKIFNISSVSGEMAYPFMSAYVASKHALEGFSKSLRMELLIYGIDVIIIGPGAIKTPIWEKVEPIDEETKNSDYGSIVDHFRKIMLEEVKDAMAVEKLAHKIYDIFIDNKPRARYAILNQRWSKWIIPRYFLSHRQLDKFVRKMFFGKKNNLDRR